MSDNPTRPPTIDRFRRPYYQIDSTTQCWNWLRGFMTGGYGVIWSPELQRNEGAHRYFYRKAKGPIPEGYEVDHACVNVRCVNPDHLEAVTPTENKRRSARTKLTLQIVAEIRQRHLSDPQEYVLTAKEFGVSPSLISFICQNQRWKDPEYQKQLEAVYGQ